MTGSATHPPSIKRNDTRVTVVNPADDVIFDASFARIIRWSAMGSPSPVSFKSAGFRKNCIATSPATGYPGRHRIGVPSINPNAVGFPGLNLIPCTSTFPSFATTSGTLSRAPTDVPPQSTIISVSYTHLRAHETRHELVCRLLLEKK